jgi:predicted DCC family thiol-disulfide oxidoreductase YuxK
MNIVRRFWHLAFLDFRPSISLGLFRIAVAVTVGAHMLPSFFHMADNYLSTAFKTQNPAFFPAPILTLVAMSPDWVVWAFVALFLLSWLAFAAGLAAQFSAILLTLTCYYFYALNNYHIGTLSFDILLVTLILLCITGFHGDFLSVDSLRTGNVRAYKRPRPYFLQRLLQLQLALTFWHTALNKISAGGNWLTDSPYYYLMHYPPMGVVRNFPLRDFLAQHQGLCNFIGLGVVAMELALPFLWFIPRTRPAGIAIGVIFQLLLWATLHVPTIFLFLFPPMMLLFIRPETLVRWVEARQAVHAERGRAVLLYDGQCGFCISSVAKLRVLDLFGWVDPLDFHAQPELARIHPALTPDRCRSEMVLLEPNGMLTGGFDAFARLARSVPLLWGAALLAGLPGVPWLGRKAYRWVAEHRGLFHRREACRTNQCAATGAADAASN